VVDGYQSEHESIVQGEGDSLMADKKSKAMKKRPQDLKKDKNLSKVQMVKAVGGAYMHKNSKGDTYY